MHSWIYWDVQRIKWGYKSSCWTVKLNLHGLPEVLWVWAIILLPNQLLAWQSWNCRGQKRRACSHLALQSHIVQSHCSAPEREHLHILSVVDKWVNPVVSGIYQLRTPRLGYLALTNYTLNKTAKRKQETDTFSFDHAAKPGLDERACITCGTARSKPPVGSGRH